MSVKLNKANLTLELNQTPKFDLTFGVKSKAFDLTLIALLG